jgi:hypothetical protein
LFFVNLNYFPVKFIPQSYDLVLRKIIGPKRDEVTRRWRKLHVEELRNLYFLPSKIRIIKSRRMMWVGHVARMGREETRIGYWLESPTERGR